MHQMKNEKKTKKQLLQQVVTLRQRINELENSKTEPKQGEEGYQNPIEEEGDIIYTLDNRKNIPIPEKVIQKWQNIVNIMAKIINVPAALIMKADPPCIEIFCSSESSKNPYKVGEREYLAGLYCERVISTKDKLLVPNALKDGDWDKNPDIKLGMISHLGFPLLWPEGEVFGTICVLDLKENRYSKTYGELMLQFKELVEAHLGLLCEKLELKKIISERKEMQERLVRQEKLAVLGELAAGVAHELRNPLGAIKNAACFLSMALQEPEPEVKETLEILEKEVATSESIINGLLDFARPKPPALRKVDVNHIVQEALARIKVPENIQVVSQLDQALPNILADTDQLAQVFSNLILNAVQAMPDGGKLTVKSEVPTPQWVSLSFADTGVGIPRENLGSLFEPVFATKAKGIGLSIVRGIIENHDGKISVQSQMGKGTTFTLRFPLKTDSPQEENK